VSTGSYFDATGGRANAGAGCPICQGPVSGQRHLTVDDIRRVIREELAANRDAQIEAVKMVLSQTGEGSL
jgi:hypothetical protein